MATQPQKNNLVNLFENTITTNKETIEDNKLTIVETQKIIDDFTPSCTGFDNKIVSLVSQINTLKAEIAALNLTAYNSGCGVLLGSTDIYPDTAIDNYYNLSSSTYEDDSPYNVSSQTLTASNVGFGTFLTYKADNNQSVGLGTSFASIGSCDGTRVTGCNSGNCANYATQISDKQNQIVSLRSQISPLILTINVLKTQRTNYQTRRWSDLHTNKELTIENQQLQEALRILNDPANDLLV